MLGSSRVRCVIVVIYLPFQGQYDKTSTESDTTLSKLPPPPIGLVILRLHLGVYILAVCSTTRQRV